MFGIKKNKIITHVKQVGTDTALCGKYVGYNSSPVDEDSLVHGECVKLLIDATNEAANNHDKMADRLNAIQRAASPIGDFHWSADDDGNN